MGLIQTVEWQFLCPPDEARAHLASALTALEMDPKTEGDTVTGQGARSVRRNRWASKFQATPRAAGAGSLVSVSVDMLGDKHMAVLADIAGHLPEGVLDDRGLEAAISKLSKISRLAGRKEIGALVSVLRGPERVLAVGQGEYQKRQGLIVLTDERLFFFEKGMVRETMEQFMLGSISSLEVKKKMSGERLVIHASGNAAVISQLDPGQAEEISSRFYELRRAQSASAAAQPAPAAATPDPLAQIERLAELRDKGLLSAEEFEAKKAELLGRI